MQHGFISEANGTNAGFDFRLICSVFSPLESAKSSTPDLPSPPEGRRTCDNVHGWNVSKSWRSQGSTRQVLKAEQLI